jgi:hypothetical protein
VLAPDGSRDPVRSPAGPIDDQYWTMRRQAVRYVLERDFPTIYEDRCRKRASGDLGRHLGQPRRLVPPERAWHQHEMRVIPLQRRPVSSPSSPSPISGQNDLLLRRNTHQRKRDPRPGPRPPEQLHHTRIGAAIHHGGLPRYRDRKEGMAEQDEKALLAALVQPGRTADHNQDRPLAAQTQPCDSRRHIRELTWPGDASGMAIAELKQSHIHPRATVLDRLGTGKDGTSSWQLNQPTGSLFHQG